MIADRQAVTAINVDSGPAEEGARRFAAAGESIKATAGGIVDRNDRLQKSAEDTGRAFQRIESRMDPLLKAQRALARDLSVVDNELIRLRISADRHAEAVKFLNDEYEQTARRLNPVIRAQEAAAQAATDLAAANDNLRRKYSPLYAAQSDYVGQLKEIKAAAAAGILTQEESAAAIAGTKAAFVEQVREIKGGNDTMTRGWKLNQQGLLQLQASGVNTLQALASGMSVTTVASTQSAQVLGALVQGGLVTTKMLLGVGGAIAGVATAIGVMAAAYGKGVFESKEFERVTRSTGNAAGITAGALEDIVDAASASGDVGIAAARGLALEMAATGKIGVEVIGKLTAMTADFAELSQKDSEEAGKALTEVFTDPLKGARDLDAAYNFLTVAQLAHIRTLVEQGQRTEAQIVLADALNERMKNLADDGLTWLGRRWRDISQFASEAWDAMKGLGREDTLEEKIQAAQDRLQTERDTGASPKRLSDLQKILDDLVGQKTRQDDEAARQAAEARFREETKALADITRGYDDFGTRQEELRNQSIRFGNAIDDVKEHIQALGDVDPSTGALAELRDLLAKLELGADAVKAALKGMRTPLETSKAQTDIAREVADLAPSARGPRQAYLTELDRASHGTKTEQENAATLAAEARTRAVIALNTALDDQGQLSVIVADETLKVADAYRRSAAEGAAAEAHRRAAQEAFQNGVDVEVRARQILSAEIDKTIEAGDKSIVALQREATERQAIAAAALDGAEAQRQATLQAKIDQATLAERSALVNADAEQERRLQEIITAKTEAIKAEAAAARDLATAQSLQGQADRLTMLEAELDVIGASNEARAVQIAHAQALIDLHKREGDALTENEEHYVAQAEQIARTGTELERQKSAFQEFGDTMGRTFDTLGSNIVSAVEKGTSALDTLLNVGREVSKDLLSWFVKLGTVNPLKNLVTGGNDLPTLGGVLGAASRSPIAGGSAGGGTGILGPLSNAVSSGSSAGGGLASFLFGTAPVDLSGGIGAISTAGTPGLFGTFGAGASTFAAVAPWIAAAAAIALPLVGSLFKRSPSVGETSVARITDLGDTGSTVFSFDNGGSNTSVLTGVIKGVTDAIEAGLERYSGTLRAGSGFDFGYFPSPESGNSQSAGINIKPIIASVLEDRDRFKGLSEQDAIEKATVIALKEMVDYQSDRLDTIAKTSTAEDLATLKEHLDFGYDRDLLSAALEELGAINSNTLTTAEGIVAVQKSAQEFAKGSVGSIVEDFQTARELFPAENTVQTSGRQTVRSVIVGRAGEDERYIDEGDSEFSRYAYEDGARIISRIVTVDREVTSAADNYVQRMGWIREATEIAIAGVGQLGDQIAGTLGPAGKGVLGTEIDQGVANADALAPYLNSLNEEIEQAYIDFPQLTEQLGALDDVLIDVTGTIEDIQDRFTTNAIGRYKSALGAEAAGVGDAYTQLLALAPQLSGLMSDAVIAGIDSDTLASVIDNRFSAIADGLDSDELTALISAFQGVQDQVHGADIVLGELSDALADTAQAVVDTARAAEQAAVVSRRASQDTVAAALDPYYRATGSSILAGLGINSGGRPTLTGRIDRTLSGLTGTVAEDVRAIDALYDQIVQGHKRVTEEELSTIISAVTEEARARAALHQETMQQIAQQREEMAQFASSTGSDIAGYLAKLRASDDGGGTYTEQLASARQSFVGQLSLIATSQNESVVRNALSSITDYAETYRALLREGEASGVDYRSALDFIEQSLATLPMVQSDTDRIVEAIDAQPEIMAAAIMSEFSGLDLNGDLVLTLDELRQALGEQASEATLQAVLSQLDIDGDGQISAMEAIADNTGVGGPLAKQNALTGFFENLWGPANNSYLKQLLEAMTEQDAVASGRVWGSGIGADLSSAAASGSTGLNNVSRAAAVNAYYGGDWQEYFGNERIRGYVLNDSSFLADIATLFNTGASWSEDRYLSLNPDVASAVSDGDFTSGLQHYLLHGLFEGRRFAEGGMITGGVPGVDSVPILGQQGERVFSVPHSRMLERLAAHAVNDNSGVERRLDEVIRENRALRALIGPLLRQSVQAGQDTVEEVAGMRQDTQRARTPVGRRKTGSG